MNLENFQTAVKLKSRVDEIDELLQKYDDCNFVVFTNTYDGNYRIESTETLADNDFGTLAKDFVDCRRKQLKQEREKLIEQLKPL